MGKQHDTEAQRNPNYYDLNIRECRDLVIATWRARRAHAAKVAPLVIGAPGTGKTELGKILARATQRPFVPQEMQGSADEDINGIPARVADLTNPNAPGQVWRFPIGPLRMAAQQPSVLMLDEIDRSGAQKQGVILALLRERRAGDTFLHLETDLLLAANGASSGGTHSLISAFLNRCLPVNFVQDPEEVQEYLAGGWVKAEQPDPIDLGVPNWTPEQLNTALAELMLDYSATAAKAPLLICTEPPAGAEENGAPWASGRAIVEGLKVLNIGLASGLKGDTLAACLAGCVSKEAAASYFQIRKTRDRLPAIDDIEKNPKKALVPAEGDVDANIGVLGLCAVAAKRNANNAWIYAGRLQNRECAQALCKGLMKNPPMGNPEAMGVKLKLMSMAGIAQEV